jgi:hypothetical protein
MAGAGTLPGRAAAEARRQGWRVAAFAFEDAPGLAEAADDFIPSVITDIQSVLTGLAARRVSAAVFVGKLWKSTVFFRYDQPTAPAGDSSASALRRRAHQMVVRQWRATSRCSTSGTSVPVAAPRGTLGARPRVPPNERRSARASAWRRLAPTVARPWWARGVTVAGRGGNRRIIRRGGRSRAERWCEGSGGRARLPLRRPRWARPRSRPCARAIPRYRPGEPRAARRSRRGGRRRGGHRGGKRR